MTVENRHDAILVRIIHTDSEGQNGKCVASYYTTAIDQTLKMFITAKDHDISCHFNEFSEVVDKDIVNFPEYTITDVNLQFGSREDLPVIEVYI